LHLVPLQKSMWYTVQIWQSMRVRALTPAHAMRTLTAFAFFSEGTAEELKKGGWTKVTATELAERWRALSEGHKRPWEEKASAAQEAYLQECTQRFLDADGDAAEAGEEAEEAEEGGEGGGEEADDESNGRTSASMILPFARVKRIAQEHLEHGSMSREGVFTVSKVRAPAHLDGSTSLRTPPLPPRHACIQERRCDARRRRRCLSIDGCGGRCG
jgi:hypothetical protein